MPRDRADRYTPERLGPTGNAVKNNIRFLRLQRKMSVEEMAGRLDYLGWPAHPVVLYRIERGNRRVDVDELALFAKVFRVDAGDMLQPMKLPAMAAAS